MDTDSGRDATVGDRRAAMPRRGHPRAPIAELVKTWQCPPCTPISAAAIPATATRAAAITIVAITIVAITIVAITIVAASAAAILATAIPVAAITIVTAPAAAIPTTTAAPAAAAPAAAISAAPISVAPLADTVDALDRIPAIRRTIVLNGRYAVSPDSGRAAGVPGSTPCHHGAR
jgi:hypothetical protein